MAENFKLPGSSYEEFVKILKAYATGKVGNPQTLTAIAQTAGMDKTIVSRNNGFLIQLALISEGNKKSPTQEGLDLGRAYSLKMDDQVVRIWRSIIDNDEFLSRMLSAIRIRGGMEKASFVNHILYSSGSSNTTSTRAGASTIIEIFKVAKLIDDKDGQIIACEIDESATGEITDSPTVEHQTVENGTTVYRQVEDNGNLKKEIIINVNIDAKVEDLDELSEKLKGLLQELNS